MEKLKIMNTDLNFALRAVIFGLHFVAAMIVLGVMFGCEMTQFNESMFGNWAYDYATWAASAQYDGTCTTAMSCYRQGKPWDNGYTIPNNLYWNPYGLLFIMEWVTMGMAGYYLTQSMLYKFPQYGKHELIARVLCCLWNAVGLVIYIIYFGYYHQTNWMEFFLAIIAFSVSTLAIFFYHVLVDMWLNLLPHGINAKDVPTAIIVDTQQRAWNIPRRFVKGNAYTRVGTDIGQLVMEEYEIGKEFRIRFAPVLRYAEYAITSPILYLAMMDIMLVGPPYWAMGIGFICMVACCLYGIPLHIMHIMEQTMERLQQVLHDKFQIDPPPKENPHQQITIVEPSIPTEPGEDPQPVQPVVHVVHPQPTAPDWPETDKFMKRKPIIQVSILGNKMSSEEMRIAYVRNYNNKIDMDEDLQGWFNTIWAWGLLGKWRSNWVAKLHYMQMSWYCLMVALGILIYLGRMVLATTLIPSYVLACLWILIIMYASFGIVASLFYGLLGDGSWVYMDLTLELLSLFAKVPIIIILAAGYLGTPGATCRP